MRTMAITCLLFAGLVLSTSGCKNNNVDPRSMEKYKIHLFEDNPYLAEIWWGDDYDPEYAAELGRGIFNSSSCGGACSSWHQGSFHGRNIDWMMRDYASIIVHMPKTDKVKYASVSLITGIQELNKDFIESYQEIPEELRSWLPAAAVDGLNECGVAINHNIVLYDGKPYVSDGDIISGAVCRYVLDNAASAKEAVELLKAKRVTQSVIEIANDYSHFFISDPDESYVVEWIEGELVATQFTGDGKGNFISKTGQPAIMTNYFVAMAEKYGFKTDEFFKQHTLADGIERSETIAAQLPEAQTVEDHFKICKSVWYKQSSEGAVPWYTENSEHYGYCPEKGLAFWWYPEKTDIHWMDNGDIYGAAKALYESGALQSYWDDFNNNWNKIDPTNNFWYTQHSVVYDLKAKKGYVIMQEGMFSDKVIEISIQ